MASPDRPSDRSRPLEELHPNERIKAESRGLRGTLAAGLADPVTGGLPNEADLQLLRLHGMYQQDDRDLRTERRQQKLEPAYQLMMRVRLPGGVCQPAQYLALDEIARTFGNRTLRLTSRQTFQLHGVLKRDAKQTVRALQQVLLDTIAACGDVNRTVLCSPNPDVSAVHAETYALAKKVSEHLLPRTRAYYEIWLDREPVAGGDEEEVIYGSTYLPRKFKIGFVVPPSNDIDVYAQDLGFVAIVDGERLAGFDVLTGGGMGRTDNEPATYPRLADIIGFCTPAQVIDVAENVVKLQRDFGNRVDRRRARLKYTIDDRGLSWFVAELERRLGFALGEARPFTFETHGDRFGWTRSADGRWHYTLFVENGRIADTAEVALLTGLREVAGVHTGELRLTPNQNLILSNVADEQRDRLQALLDAYRLERGASVLRRQAMACVALPTCGLAMAEAERYLPGLITQLEAIAATCGLGDEPIVVRMSGCPNGCSRPYLAEIAFTGRAPGRYNVYLGGGFYGQRLAHLYRENAGEAQILAELTALLSRYAAERQAGERFGDFVLRTGVVPVSSSSRAASP